MSRAAATPHWPRRAPSRDGSRYDVGLILWITRLYYTYVCIHQSMSFTISNRYMSYGQNEFWASRVARRRASTLRHDCQKPQKCHIYTIWVYITSKTLMQFLLKPLMSYAVHKNCPQTDRQTHTCVSAQRVISFTNVKNWRSLGVGHSCLCSHVSLLDMCLCSQCVICSHVSLLTFVYLLACVSAHMCLCSHVSLLTYVSSGIKTMCICSHVSSKTTCYYSAQTCVSAHMWLCSHDVSAHMWHLARMCLCSHVSLLTCVSAHMCLWN